MALTKHWADSCTSVCSEPPPAPLLLPNSVVFCNFPIVNGLLSVSKNFILEIVSYCFFPNALIKSLLFFLSTIIVPPSTNSRDSPLLIFLNNTAPKGSGVQRYLDRTINSLSQLRY